MTFLSQHLKEQQDQDDKVKALAERLPFVFDCMKDVKESPGTAERLVRLISEGEALFLECVTFIVDYCSSPTAGLFHSTFFALRSALDTVVPARTFRAAVDDRIRNQYDSLKQRYDSFKESFALALSVHTHNTVTAAPVVAPPP
jgi:hypothetical protein